jgi:hypothetical protein
MQGSEARSEILAEITLLSSLLLTSGCDESAVRNLVVFRTSDVIMGQNLRAWKAMQKHSRPN